MPSAKHNKTNTRKKSEILRTFTALTYISRKIQKAYRLLKIKVFVSRIYFDKGISEKECKVPVTVLS
jgi:hypothetical protein